MRRIIDIPAGNYNLKIPNAIIFTALNKLYLQCQSSQGVITISLPKISQTSRFVQAWGFHIYIADTDQNAATNNINIVAAPGDIISGGAAAVINTNGGFSELVIAGYTFWGCLLGPVPASGGSFLQGAFFNAIGGQNDYVFDGVATAWNPAALNLIGKNAPLFTLNGLAQTPQGLSPGQYIWTPGTGTLSIVGTVWGNTPCGLYYQ